MITQQELQGSWNQIKGKLKERWGQLTDNDLSSAEGSIENLIGLIQQKFGVARRDVESFIDQSYAQSTTAARRISDTAQDYARTAQDYAKNAADSVSNGYEELSNHIQRGFADTQQLVRRSPAESVAAAFGVGILTGIIAALVLRSPK